ncbi:caskin-2-like isoform X2 [Amphibalanus amphitrite]|uniref:caskin-2-like isoform X2 n=1 Tax=Amphibalanus amphitrite TaxID=1232801 RepID=UPI001C91E254|nr:caskin-2-like isoform X2 [Amphibalanus amphitrite]
MDAFKVGGMHRPNKPAQIRRVPPPTVPEQTSHRHSGSSFSSGYGSLGQPDSRSSCGDEHLVPPHSPLDLPPSPGPDSVEGSMYSGSNRLSSGSSGLSPGPQAGYNTFSFPTAPAPRAVASPGGPACSHSGKEFVPHFHNHLYQHQQSDDQGIDVQSPGRDSPSSAGSSTSSFGCRNSTSSLDSGRASSAYDSKASHPTSLNRLSGQSYESGSSYRQSYHSSSSSLGSLEKDDAISRLHVAQMLADGMKDSEVLNAWLTDFHFEEYYQLFVNAGYDMPTVSRMTPEDLTAIGITKPAHRRKLKAEIARLNISDGIPDFIPDSLDGWLHLLRLSDYAELLRAQGYSSVQQATEITWEDLEEIGISRLGHQKKITLAIKRAKDILTGKRVPSQYQHQYTTQEIAIPATASPTEPTYQQLKTFQQQPAAARADSWADPGRYQGFSQYRPLPLQQVQVQVETSADVGCDEPPPPPAPQTQLQYFEQQRYVLQGPSSWRRSYEDGDLTPTNEPVPLEASGTLPRQRPGAGRQRPVAKIVAKTRDSEPESDRDAPVKPVKQYGSLPRDPLKRMEVLGAPPAPFSTPQGTPRKPVPAPPRRDSLRAEALAAARHDFPPPPLPLVVRDSGDASDASDCESASPATGRATRNDSSASFKSTSSTESDSFPFANDNAGTIKQRTQRSHTAGDLPSSLSAKSGKAAAGAGQGDVLNDIGSMLADLTDELDAMLELESEAP